MEMISHKAKDHHEEEDVFDVKIHSTPKEEEIKKASFILSESMEKDQLEEIEAELSSLKKELMDKK